jgi:hypothetical protein
MRRMLLLFFLTGLSISSAPRLQQEVPALLEVHFVDPMRWESGCLRGGLDILNHSPSPLFLTQMGPYFYVPLDVSKDEPGNGEKLEWVNIYGVTDMVSMEADALAAGSSVHRDFCFQPTAWVVNMNRKTRREIPVRGKLRVEVSYFASEGEWKKWKDSSGDESKQIQRSRLWSRALAKIPCPNTTCDSDCNRPPVGVHGEGRLVPDTAEFFPEMNARGKKLTDELSRKFPPCSGANTSEPRQHAAKSP